MASDFYRLNDGKLAILTDDPQPGLIDRIEYHAAEKCFELYYENKLLKARRIPYVLPTSGDRAIESLPATMVVVHCEEQQDPYGYDVPLVRVD